MDDHIARILKMLEDGKISAEDAEKLISAISREQAAPPPPPPPNTGTAWSTTQSPPPPRPERPEEEKKEEGSGAKSFEFSWSKKSGLPFDLSDARRSPGPLPKGALRPAFSKTRRRSQQDCVCRGPSPTSSCSTFCARAAGRRSPCQTRT